MDLGVEKLSEAIKLLPTLDTLNLSIVNFYIGNNGITATGAKFVAKIMEEHNLIVLNLSFFIR